MRKKINGLMLVLLVSVFSGLFHVVEPAWATERTINASASGGSITITGQHFPKMTGDSDFTEVMNEPLEKYKSLATIVTGFGTVTAFLAMIFCFTKLSAAGDNEQARKRAIAGIFTSGIGIALLGSATIIIGFFWKILQPTGS